MLGDSPNSSGKRYFSQSSFRLGCPGRGIALLVGLFAILMKISIKALATLIYKHLSWARLNTSFYGVINADLKSHCEALLQEIALMVCFICSSVAASAVWRLETEYAFSTIYLSIAVKLLKYELNKSFVSLQDIQA